MSFNKGNAVFKHKAEDFIVEEIGIDGKISEVSIDIGVLEGHKVDINIDVNDRRPFIYFDVEKINLDHFNLINIISEKLNKRPHEIGYAGTKDKIAWTCQKISIFDPDVEKIRSFSQNNMIIKNVKWGKHKIKIGDLKGNRFKIILRDVDENALKVLNRVRNTKFIPNLFGSQRFGSVRKDNFIIGKLILKRKYKEAIFAYLTGYGTNEHKEIKEAKKKLKEEKNILAAKKYFPQQLHVEHKIITHLENNKDDFIGALKQIGDKVLLIMVQSVQSKLFNEILERAIELKAIKESERINLIGNDHQFSEGKLGRLERDILKENDMEIEDFIQDDFIDLSLRSSKRKAFFEVRDMNIEIENDEEFEKAKKIVLTFILDSGSYATTFLEYFFDLR